jgi:hypothetical protein
LLLVLPVQLQLPTQPPTRTHLIDAHNADVHEQG